MASEIQNMINNVLGDGARSTKFECLINFITPDLYSSSKDIVTLTKTSSFPGKQHEINDFKFKGRSIPLRGQAKYEQTWSCTFYLEQDHKLRNSFLKWLESIEQQHNYDKSNKEILNAQLNNIAGYSTDLFIFQQDFDGAQNTVMYQLKNCFPKSVSQVEVSYESAAQVLEYTVEFSYTHFEVHNIKSKDGSFVDNIKNKVIGEIQNVVSDVKSLIQDTIKDSIGSINNQISSAAVTLETKAKGSIEILQSFNPFQMVDSNTKK